MIFLCQTCFNPQIVYLLGLLVFCSALFDDVLYDIAETKIRKFYVSCFKRLTRRWRWLSFICWIILVKNYQLSVEHWVKIKEGKGILNVGHLVLRSLILPPPHFSSKKLRFLNQQKPLCPQYLFAKHFLKIHIVHLITNIVAYALAYSITCITR